MRVLLVNPLFPYTYWGFQHALRYTRKRAALPPLGLITLAALLPDDWKLRLIDLNVRSLRDADLRWADVVLVGGMRIQAESLHQVLARARALGRRTVVGGPAASSAPDDFSDADIVFCGEAEGRIDQLTEAIDDVRPEPVVVAAPAERPEITGSPLPRYDLLDFDRYGSTSVQYSRGCPFNCEFCDIIKLFGRRPRVKSNSQVLAEFDELYRLGHRGSVFFVDDNFIGNKPAVKKLLPELQAWQEERGYPFELYTEASVNLASDEALLASMVAAGFASVFLGIETPSPEALGGAGKKQNLKVDLTEAVDRITRAGIEVFGGFIVGFDQDDERAFDVQHGFLSSSPIPLAMVGLLNAMPGTALWQRLEREGRLRHDFSGNQFDRPNFEPTMDEETLLEGYADLMRKLYSPDEYYQRCLAYIDRAVPPPGIRRGAWRWVPTLLRACFGVGFLHGRRRHYWKLLYHSLRHAPHTFAWAVGHAVMGEHMIRYTHENLVPALEQALADVRAQRAADAAPGAADAAPGAADAAADAA